MIPAYVMSFLEFLAFPSDSSYCPSNASISVHGLPARMDERLREQPLRVPNVRCAGPKYEVVDAVDSGTESRVRRSTLR